MPIGPVLLCYDGSDEAGQAIIAAAERLHPREAIVLTIREAISKWQPDDPRAVRSADAPTLDDLDPDEAAAKLAQEALDKGLALTREAGFDARGLLAGGGKTWRAICDVAAELDASTIVLGARGLSRVQHAVLGSVSGAVAQHAKRPVLIVPAQQSAPAESDTKS